MGALVMLDFFQIALVSTDLPATARLYAEAFDYCNAGGQISWASRIQALGKDARHVMWWLVGDQDFFQLECFGYVHPVTRPLPDDWRPSDLGWTRFGVTVPNFDKTMSTLKGFGIEPLAPAVVKDGCRHVAIRDPYAGPIVEVIESKRAGQKGPIIAYVTSSVSDLAAARAFYEGTLELRTFPLEQLHSPADESLWGLPGAAREGFLVEVSQGFLEIVCYSSPAGRPRRPDHRLSDQGIQNISLGSRKREVVARVLDRVKTAGFEPAFIFENGENICGYINDAEREFELASIPESLDEPYGFKPLPIDFFGKRNSKLWD